MDNMRLTFIRRPLFFIFLCHNAFAKSNVVPGVFGDPHFTGWDGVHFDFNGKPDSIYCLISDKTFHMNMKLAGTVESTVQQRTWIKALGILFWSHRLILRAAESHRLILRAAEGSDLSHNGSGFLQNIEVDGAVIQLKQGENYGSLDGVIIISYDNYQSHEFLPSDHYSVYLKDIAEIHVIAGPEIPDLRSDNDAFIHLSVEMEKAVLSSQVHGVLGQTYLNAKGRLHRNAYRTKWNDLLVAQQVDGPNGEGYLDGEVADYISSGTLSSNCHFSRFDANFDPSNKVLGYSRKHLPDWDILAEKA